MTRSWLFSVLVLFSLMVTPVASAQEAEDGPVRLGDAKADTQISLSEEAARAPSDPWEDPQESYLFLGAFYRHNFIPGFMLGLFLADYTTTNNSAFGLELTYRKDGLDIATSLSYQSFDVHGPYRAEGDPETDVEFIDSDLSVIFAGTTFLWSTPFNDVVSLQYGLGLGLGVVTGSLVRNEAYPDADNNSGHAVSGFSRCSGPSVPDSVYCEADVADPSNPDARGGHYDFEAAKWFDSGSVPNLYFRLALPHLALRIKPVRQFMMRVEGGFDFFSGFFVGGSMAYGF